MSSQMEPYLADSEVLEVQGKLYDEYPQLKDWNTNLVTTRIEPPWHGQLPDGRTGWTQHPVVQFVVVSDHPRPIQRRMGVRHGTYAVAWQNVFESTRKARSHYVSNGETDPLETIFRAVLKQHIGEIRRLALIINDAVSDPSKPKSALEAL